MKTAIIIGRFQPVTLAHYEIIQSAINTYDETYVVVINSIASIVANSVKRARAAGVVNVTPEQEEQGWDRRRKEGRISKSYSNAKLQAERDANPFSGMTRKKLIYKAFSGKLHESRIITHPAANVEQIINKVYIASRNTDFVILCGQDREAGYEAQIKSAFEKKFFVPEVENVELKVSIRDVDSADTISATRVRETIKNNEFEEFKELTPPGIHGDFTNLQRILIQEGMAYFLRRMLTEMTHIEDLNVKDFINFVKNIYESEASIKLDGTAALAFGFDQEGKFYTGFGRDFKEVKPEQRRYSTEDWLKQRNIFNNPGASAHTFLEKNIPTLKKYIKNGETSLAEILFGDKPNCIKYNFSGINYLVILDNEPLADKLDGEKMNIDTVNCILEVDNVVPQAVKQVWKFGRTQKVDPAKYVIDVEQDLKELEIFLGGTTDGLRNIDIIGMRAAGKNKDLVQKVRDKAETYKLNIKEKLLDQFVRKVRDGEYIPSEGYSHEGIVLKLGDERVKIIDKEVFTSIHDRDWEPVHAAKKIQKTMPKEQALIELDKMINNFDSLYPNVSDDVRVRMKNQLRMTKIFIRDGNDGS